MIPPLRGPNGSFASNTGRLISSRVILVNFIFGLLSGPFECIRVQVRLGSMIFRVRTVSVGWLGTISGSDEVSLVNIEYYGLWFG